MFLNSWLPKCLSDLVYDDMLFIKTRKWYGEKNHANGMVWSPGPLSFLNYNIILTCLPP